LCQKYCDDSQLSKFWNKENDIFSQSGTCKISKNLKHNLFTIAGESCSKPSPKDQEINSKHTKTSLTRLEKSTVKSTKPKKSEPRELEDEEEPEDDEDDAGGVGGGSEEVSISIEAEPVGKVAADGIEMSMQTDVTLVPLINSNRTQLEDEDLDSGIAMGEERNKRLTYLTNKKSIFTIAYDDVGIQKIGATSASPVS
jgi:hypothetical protein